MNEQQQRSWFSRFLLGVRDIGVAFGNVVPALRSAKGTYGTQRAESAEIDARRRASYPRD